MQGYLIINCIIGGQTLASVSSRLNATAGIVITGLISLAVRHGLSCGGGILTRDCPQVTFCGYQTLHWFVICSVPY